MQRVRYREIETDIGSHDYEILVDEFIICWGEHLTIARKNLKFFPKSIFCGAKCSVLYNQGRVDVDTQTEGC